MAFVSKTAEVDGCYNSALRKHIFMIFQMYAHSVIFSHRFKIFTVTQGDRSYTLLHIVEIQDTEIKRFDWKWKNHSGTEDRAFISFYICPALSPDPSL